MKIKLSAAFIFLAISFSFAQVTSNVIIEGTIKAGIEDDVEGIVIYNRNTNKGTISDSDGNFKIIAGLDDKLDVTAMQYQKFIIIVDKGVVENKKLNIFLRESVNLLDEVIVTPYDLSGNVNVDVKKISITESKIAEATEEASTPINEADYENWKPDELSAIKANPLMVHDMRNGLNFVNLFKVVFQNNKGKKNKEDIDVALRNMYDDQFFQKNLALDLDQINDFIFYAESNGLNNSYLKEGKELDLIEFLIEKSNSYKKEGK